MCNIIGVDTGHAIDSYVVSNMCYICKLNTDTGIEHECQPNFTGSAQTMEVEAACVIFKLLIINIGIQ